MIEFTLAIGLLVIGGLLAAVGLVIVAISSWFSRRLPSVPHVEFLPPASGSIYEHGLAMRADRRVPTAAIIDLAVKRKVRVLTGDGRRGSVGIHIVPGADLSDEERDFLNCFRPQRMKPRQERRYLEALAEIGIHVENLAAAPDVVFLRGKGAFRGHRRRGLTAFFDRERKRLNRDGFTHKWANNIHLILLSLLFLVTAVSGLFMALGAIITKEYLGVPAVLVGIAAVFWVLTISPPPILRFTEKGDALRRHLSGLRGYMRLAERDRLRVLQSPGGALRTPAGALTVGGEVLGLETQPSQGDPVAQSALDRFVLTERLLPYAVLFRHEEEWQKEFEHLGGTVEMARTMRTLGQTLDGVVTVLYAIGIMLEVLRFIGALLSLFGRR